MANYHEIERSEDYPVPDILPRCLIPIDKPDAWLHACRNSGQVVQIILPVAICVKDELFRSRFKPAPKRASVATIDQVSNDTEAVAEVLSKLRQHLGRVVAAPV